MQPKQSRKKVQNSVALLESGNTGDSSEQSPTAAIAQPEACSNDYFLDPDRPLMTVEQQTKLAGDGVHSARGLKRTSPAVYDGVLRALNEGIGIRSIATAYRVSVNTVYAVREREYLPAWADKSKIKKLVRKLAYYSLERIEEELPSLPADKLPVLMGILVDKMQALDGEPGTIIEHRQTVTLQSWEDVIASLPCLPVEKTASGAVIETESQ